MYGKEKSSLRLASIEATRWRSKNDAIVKIFDGICYNVNLNSEINTNMLHNITA